MAQTRTVTERSELNSEISRAIEIYASQAQSFEALLLIYDLQNISKLLNY
jgi:hypothetical protein